MKNSNHKAKRNIRRIRNGNFIFCEVTKTTIFFDITYRELKRFGDDSKLSNNYGLRKIINMILNARVAGPTA